MDMVLITIGLLLIAMAATLMWHRERTWLVAIAQGLGVQGVIALGVSACQVMLVNDGTAKMPIEQRVETAVEGMAFNAGGWTARQTFGMLGGDDDDPATEQLDVYLVVFAAQSALIAVVFGARLMGRESDHAVGDPLLIIFGALVLTNSVANATWAWWGS